MRVRLDGAYDRSVRRIDTPKRYSGRFQGNGFGFRFYFSGENTNAFAAVTRRNVMSNAQNDKRIKKFNAFAVIIVNIVKQTRANASVTGVDNTSAVQRTGCSTRPTCTQNTCFHSPLYDVITRLYGTAVTQSNDMFIILIFLVHKMYKMYIRISCKKPAVVLFALKGKSYCSRHLHVIETLH